MGHGGFKVQVQHFRSRRWLHMARSYVHLETQERALIETQLRLGMSPGGDRRRTHAGQIHCPPRDTPQRLAVPASFRTSWHDEDCWGISMRSSATGEEQKPFPMMWMWFGGASDAALS